MTDEEERRPLARRAATASAICAVGVVEVGLGMIQLEEVGEVSEFSQLEYQTEAHPETRPNSQRESSLEVEAVPDTSVEEIHDHQSGGGENAWVPETPETSLDEVSLPEGVHKSLKDLIHKTNKNLYDVDSNKVKYKAGLSRKGLAVPSLHRRKGPDSSRA